MIYVFDLDGTLADHSQRRHLVQGEPRNFKAFFDRVGEDKPNGSAVALLRSLYLSKATILLIAGRPCSTRADTEKWLSRCGVYYHTLYMRGDGDYSNDAALAKKTADHIISVHGTPDLVFANRPDVAAVWREINVTVGTLL